MIEGAINSKKKLTGYDVRLGYLPPIDRSKEE